jgi:hypothetical protein
MCLKFDVMKRYCKNLEFGVYLTKAQVGRGENRIHRADEHLATESMMYTNWSGGGVRSFSFYI